MRRINGVLNRLKIDIPPLLLVNLTNVKYFNKEGFLPVHEDFGILI